MPISMARHGVLGGAPRRANASGSKRAIMPYLTMLLGPGGFPNVTINGSGIRATVFTPDAVRGYTSRASCAPG